MNPRKNTDNSLIKRHNIPKVNEKPEIQSSHQEISGLVRLDLLKTRSFIQIEREKEAALEAKLKWVDRMCLQFEEDGERALAFNSLANIPSRLKPFSLLPCLSHYKVFYLSLGFIVF